jgi:isopenicillin N synthase-like dioxygenase
MQPSVRIIDIAPFRANDPVGKAAVVKAVGEACEDIGFLILAGHGVSQDLIKRTYDVSRRFFDLPLEEKLNAKGDNPGKGYTGIGDEGLSRSLDKVAPVDLKEALAIGRVDTTADAYFNTPQAEFFFSPNIWPKRPAELEQVWTEYFREMQRLASDIMRIFALALQLPENYFADKIDRAIDKMRAINYPDQPQEPKPGQLRAGEHSDYGTLTILRIEDAPGGLQVKHRSGTWIDIGSVPGAFIINIGDLMQYWTNDRWVSTLHRVANPPRDAALGSRRQSLVFFQQPNHDALIECLPTCRSADKPAKHRPITSGDHFKTKFLKTRVSQPAA